MSVKLIRNGEYEMNDKVMHACTSGCSASLAFPDERFSPLDDLFSSNRAA